MSEQNNGQGVSQQQDDDVDWMHVAFADVVYDVRGADDTPAMEPAINMSLEPLARDLGIELIDD